MTLPAATLSPAELSGSFDHESLTTTFSATYNKYFGYRDSSVGIVTRLRAVRPKNRGLIPETATDFLLWSQGFRSYLGSTQPSVRCVSGLLPLVINWPLNGVMTEWTSTPPMRIYDMHRHNLSVIDTFNQWISHILSCSLAVGSVASLHGTSLMACGPRTAVVLIRTQNFTTVHMLNQAPHHRDWSRVKVKVKFSATGPWGPGRLRLPDFLDFRHYEGGKVFTPRSILVLIFRGWVDPRAHVSVCSLGKNPQRHQWGSIPTPSD